MRLIFQYLKNYWQKYKRGLEFSSLLFLLVTAIYVFFAGFHAVDLCRNELSIEHNINDMLEDNNSTLKFRLSETTELNGKKYSVEDGECHYYGIDLILISFSIMIILLIIFFTMRYADGLQRTK